MGKSFPSDGTVLPPSAAAATGVALDRIASFRVTYVAIALFVLLYVFSVKGAEQLLGRHFDRRIDEAIRVDPANGPVAEQIQGRVDAVVHDPFWVRLGGVRVTAIVIGADGQPIYAGGRRIPTPMPGDAVLEAQRILPATADVVVSVQHNSLVANAILVAYAALLIQTLFLYDRRRQRLEDERLGAALAAREATASRAAQIEAELARLTREVDDRIEAEVSEEMGSLRAERTRLQDKLESRIIARDSQDKKIVIHLLSITPDKTRMTINVTSEAKATRIYQTILEQLGQTQKAAAPTAAGTSRPLEEAGS